MLSFCFLTAKGTISRVRVKVTPWGIVTKFCMWVVLDIHDVITYATSGDDRLRGLGVARVEFPISHWLSSSRFGNMLLDIHTVWQKCTAINVKQNVLFLITPAECCYTTLSVIMLTRRYVHSLQMHISNDSLTITTILSRDLQSAGCKTVSTTRLILCQVSSHSDEGYTPTYTQTSEQTDHNIKATVSYVVGADYFQRTWMLVS